MAGNITVTGMILSAQPVGEYDRRLVLLTKEFGKLSVFANGVRRPTAALSGISQPFVFGTFTLYAGKNTYTLQAAEVENYFSNLRENLEALYFGVYFCELAESLTRENLPAKDELLVLYCSLRALTKPAIGMRLVRAVCELRMLAVAGMRPQAYECVRCGKKEGLSWFSARGGGCVCTDCVRDTGFGAEYEGAPVWSVSASTLYTMQFILSTPMESLYTFTVKEEVLLELEEILRQFLAVHIGRKYKSLEMLEAFSEGY